MRGRGALAALIMVAALTSCGGSGATPSSSASGGQGGGSCTPVVSPAGLQLVRPGALTVGSDITYPPQEFYADQKPSGFDMDLGAAIAVKLCLGFEPVNTDFGGVFTLLASNKFDVVISAVTITPDRSKTVDLVPYFSAGEQLLALSSSKVRPVNLSGLCGLRVAVEQGTKELSELAGTVNHACGGHPATILPESTDPEALEQVISGHADVELTDSPVAEYYVRQNPSQVVATSPVLEVAPEGIAIRLTDVPMQKAIEGALTAVQKDGTYDSLLRKWGLTNPVAP